MHSFTWNRFRIKQICRSIPCLPHCEEYILHQSLLSVFLSYSQEKSLTSWEPFRQEQEIYVFY